MLVIMFAIKIVYAFECVFDGDCNSMFSESIEKMFCVINKCTRVLPPMTPCNRPQECSSYIYYGSLACSAKCDTKQECGNLYHEKTTYCCKQVPTGGHCNHMRPRSTSGCARNQMCLHENGVSKCTEIPENSWFLGSILSIGGNILINLGTNYQKLSYSKDSLTIYGIAVKTLSVGIFLYILGKISSFSAYVFCNQSFLAALSATGLISNSIIAPVLNGEIFTWNDGMAIFFVIIGSLILFSSVSRTHNTYTVCELLKMLKQWRTMFWLSFIVLMIVLLFSAIKFVEVNSPWHDQNDRFRFLQNENYRFEENGVILKYLMVMLYVCLSSFIASFTTLSIKIIGEIFGRYFSNEGSVMNMLTLFFILSLVLCTTGQIYWLNRAFKHFDALIVIPIFHLTWSILSMLTAGIYFQDFSTFSHPQIKKFIVGVCIIFSGSIFLGLKIRNKDVINRRASQE